MTDQIQQTDIVESRPTQNNKKRRQSDVPKPSMTVKRAWHAACFAPRDRKGPGRKWKKFPGWMPLKVFAAQMEDTVAKTWTANKHS